jgi:cell division protein FtsA
MRAKKKNGAKTRGGLIAALDVGTTKICCLIAKPGGAEKPTRVVGIGHQASRGLRAGAIVDLEGAESSIRAAVEAAEQMAGENIRHVVVNYSGVGVASRLIAYKVALGGHAIGDADVRRVMDPEAALEGLPADHELLHTLPVGFAIDGTRGVRDPRGLHGQRLGVNLHAISAPGAALRNISTAVARGHLDIEQVVAAPYASALASLVEDEIQLGVTLIEMGGGTTTVAVFFDGELVHADCVPLGGAHVTNDIARGLSTPLAGAERLKTLYASALPSPADDRETIAVPLIGEESPTEPHLIPRSLLVGIVRPRIEEILELVKSRLQAAGFADTAGRCVVLTGGASQLSGVREMARRALDRQVRLGRPKPIEGLAEAVSGPAFSTVAGLLAFALKTPRAVEALGLAAGEHHASRFGRLGQWLRENF